MTKNEADDMKMDFYSELVEELITAACDFGLVSELGSDVAKSHAFEDLSSAADKVYTAIRRLLAEGK